MKIKDGMIGLIVGDALGVPVEFTSREELAENPVTRMEGYGTYNQPTGTWSDDSSMAIATMDSIVNKKGIDYTDIMEEFCNWRYHSKYTNSPAGTFDIGITTSNGLYNFKDGIDPILCGGNDERDNGNGSLMRILPLAFIPNIDYETIENVSSLTHRHPRSRISCVLYVEIAKSMMENDLSIREHIDLACSKIKKYYKDSEELEHFKRIFDDDLKDNISSKGYVIYTFESVVHCLETTDNFKDAVLKAVNLGRDTDTTAAICGGLAGIYYGIDDIPIDWIKQINELDKVIELCEKFEAFCDEY